MPGPEVVVYSTPWCGACRAAESLLRRKGVAFRRVDVSGDHATRAWLEDVTGQRTVPQVFVGGEPIGGYAELATLEARGELDERLAG